MKQDDDSSPLVHAAQVHTVLSETTAWKDYESSPGTETFKRLVLSTGASSLEPQLIPCLSHLYARTGNWRVAQHAALQCEKQGHATYASYFAHWALVKSGGDPLARIAWARILWMRRLPLAVVFQTNVLRAQARRVRDRVRRRLLQDAIADLNARTNAYLGDLKRVRRWFHRLVRRGSAEKETLVQILSATGHDEGLDLFRFVGLILAPDLQRFGGHLQNRIRLACKSALLNCLRQRQEQRSKDAEPGEQI